MNDYQPAKPNFRNILGIFIFIFALTLYVFLIAAGGDWLESEGYNIALQMLYYFIFGIIWFWPARGLFRWIARGQKA